MKVKSMMSSKGNPIPNQFIIDTGKGVLYFQSYESIIVKIVKDHVYLDEKTWDYSSTTGRYRNNFLGEGIADTRSKIASGEYKLTNLNKK